jgi:hypothetical protein
MKLFKSALVFSLGLASSALAGNYANEVLSIGVGARALGLGGAFVSLADDSTAVYWNPAALPRVPHVEIEMIQQGREYSGLSLNEVGSRYMFVSGALSIPKLGSFGAAFMRFGVDDIIQTSGAFNPDGSPVQVGTFSSDDFGVMVSYGRQFHPAFNAGLTVKYLSGGTSGLQAGAGVLGDASYAYTGFDLGLLSDLGGLTPALKGLSLGLNLQDALNTGIAWKNTPTSPTNLVDLNPKAGISYTPAWDFLKNMEGKWSLAFDIDPKYSPNTLYHFGTEFWYKDTIALRGGFRMFSSGGQGLESSLGASFKLYILEVDYAFINYELTPIQYLSLAAKF